MPEMLLVTAVLAAIIFFIHRIRSKHTASSYSPPDSSNISSSHRSTRQIRSADPPQMPRHTTSTAEQSSLSLFRDEENCFRSKADPSRASKKISFENDQARLKREQLSLAKEKEVHDAMRLFRDEADFEEQQRITKQELYHRDCHTFGEMGKKGILFLLNLLWRLMKWIFTGIGMLFLFYITSSRDDSSDRSQHCSGRSFDSYRSNRSNASPLPQSVRSAPASRPLNSISSSPAFPNNIRSSHSRHTTSSRPSSPPPKRSGGGGSTRGGGTGGRF